MIIYNYLTVFFPYCFCKLRKLFLDIRQLSKPTIVGIISEKQQQQQQNLLYLCYLCYTSKSMGECLRVTSASLCSSQFVYLYMRLSVCVYIYSVLFRLRPSWETNLSNQWPLEITSLLLFLLLLLLLLL